MNGTSISRRRFLHATGLATASPYFVASSALGADDRDPAGERIVMAAIGTGGRGTGVMGGLMGHSEVQMVAVCDPVPAHRERAQAAVNSRYGNSDCKAYHDFREVLARDDIDAVMIASPDHWHATMTVEACKQGKDIFCEKPESLTVAEGRAMADAVERYGRVFSGGSQRVLGDYGNWPKIIWGGGLGKIQEVFVNCGGPSRYCDLPPQPVPQGVDWDMWLGPAPWRPFHERLIRGGFRPYRDYSGGGMTDWGAHRFGAAMFAIGLHKTGPVEITPPDGNDVEHLTFRFANGVRMYHGGTDNITYIGTEGRLPGEHRPPDDADHMPTYKGRGGLLGDFLHCVKTRERPFRDIESAHRAATVCHLGNIAYWLNRPLRWDPDKEQILGDAEAARWLSRAYRQPWRLA